MSVTVKRDIIGTLKLIVRVFDEIDFSSVRKTSSFGRKLDLLGACFLFLTLHRLSDINAMNFRANEGTIMANDSK